MLQLRYILRFTTAFVKRFKGLLFIGVIIGITIFFLINIFIPYLLTNTTKVVGKVGMYKTDTLPNSINNLITTGLTKINNLGALEPGLASSWDTSDQGVSWVFHLDRNIKWHDGSQILSDDINYDFKDVDIEKPDNYTVIFKLKNKFSPFPYVVSEPLYKKGLMGVGSWKVEKIKLSLNYVEYLKIKNTSGKRIIYRFYPTENRAKLAFKLGLINSIEELTDVTPFDKWNNVVVTKSVNKNQVVTVFFNTKNNLLSDKALRQALNYSIDKNSFNFDRALGPISPLSWAYNPLVKSYDFDLKKAKELSSSVLKNNKNNNTLNFYVTPTLLDIADTISKDWSIIGIKTNILVTNSIPSEYDVFLAILDIPADPDQYSLWHSTQVSTNITKYQNQRIDKLLEDGRVELNIEERKNIYLDFQRFLIEDCPAIFLYHPNVYNIKRK